MRALTASRVFFIFVCVAYGLSIHFAHSGYLMNQHHIPFYNYNGLDPAHYIFLIAGIAVAGFMSPLEIRNPSALFSVVLLIFLYIPGIVIILGEHEGETLTHLLLALVVLLSLFIVNLPSYLFFSQQERFSSLRNRPLLIKSIFLIWGLAAIAFIWSFSSVMNFSTLTETYAQREAGRAATLFLGYLQLYFGYFLSVVLLAYGLYKKSYLSVVGGAAGCFLLYLVTAERTVFLLPIFVFLVHRSLMSMKPFAFLFSLFILLSAALFLLISCFYDQSNFLYELGFYYLNRVVAIPGLFLEHYSKYFSDQGYTYWSHVRGISSVVVPPSNLLNDPLYPQLGKIVARDVHEVNSNSNASFLATDGFAALGYFGALVISVFLSFYLFTLNVLSLNWPKEFVIPAMAPLPFVLTNGSFFTMLLSFGGLAWIVLLILGNVRLRSASGRRDLE